MKYLDGQVAMIGDHVDLGGGMTGTVVCCFDDGLCVPGFSIAEWNQLREGVLVESPEAGLIHFAEPNVDLVLLRRAQP
jgi:hypothetical protein